MNKDAPLLLLILLLSAIAGCAAGPATPVAKVFRETVPMKPGSYQFQFLLDGRDTLAEYLARQKARNPDLKDFDIPELRTLFRNAFPELHLPVQPGAPLCNLETNFGHCNGIELLADFEVYGDNTVVLNRRVLYHVRLRLEGDQPNFFRAAKAQRDRGEFALPRRYYIGSLVETIQTALPILREIATDYRKYIRKDNQEIEVELTLEESREKAAARQSEKDLKDTGEAGGSVLLSLAPNLSLLAGLTISALKFGGRTFWEVLEEEKQFEIYKSDLDLPHVGFSYPESVARNFSHPLLRTDEPPSDIIVREIIIRLRDKAPSA